MNFYFKKLYPFALVPIFIYAFTLVLEFLSSIVLAFAAEAFSAVVVKGSLLKLLFVSL